MYHCASRGNYCRLASGLQFCAALVCGKLSPFSTCYESLCGCFWVCNPEWDEERPRVMREQEERIGEIFQQVPDAVRDQ